MKEVVLDASVVVKWVRRENESHIEIALALETRFKEGRLSVVVPSLLYLELLNAFGRRWRWPLDGLLDVARRLQTMNLEIDQPALERVASWTAAGLSAYDASYVALAEQRSIELITADDRIIEIAPGIARPLSEQQP